MARGLPTEGEKANERRAAEVSRDDVVTASMGDRIGGVKSRVDASPYGFSLVTDGDRILLGRLRRAALAGDPQQAVERVMEAGYEGSLSSVSHRPREAGLPATLCPWQRAGEDAQSARPFPAAFWR
jgi:hypothetical protein